VEEWGPTALRRSKARRQSDFALAIGGVLFAIVAGASRFGRVAGSEVPPLLWALLGIALIILGIGAYLRWRGNR